MQVLSSKEAVLYSGVGVVSSEEAGTELYSGVQVLSCKEASTVLYSGV